MRTPWICEACGTAFDESESPPDRCPICLDERAFVNPKGQRWTTLEEVRSQYHNAIRELEAGLFAIRTEGRFGGGQRAFLVRGGSRNVLWNCITLIDDQTVKAIRELGGISAIAISHPHFYKSMVEWSRAFGGVPIFVHRADRQWVMRHDPAIVFWEGDARPLGEGLTLLHCGGHFDGASALHWAQGAGGRGAILTGDTIHVLQDGRMTFMYGYPTVIPLSVAAMERVLGAVEQVPFERVYGAWSEVLSNGKESLRRSAERYRRAIQG